MKAAARERYIPTDSREVTHPDGLGVVYVYTGKRPAAIAYGGKRSKPDWHFIFQSEQSRDKKIADYFKSLSVSANMKQTEKEAQNKPHTLQVGQIVCNSWGYDQTNVDFYQITRVSAHFIWLRRIGADLTETGFMSGYVTPKPNCFLEDSPEEMHKVYTWDDSQNGSYTGIGICFEHGSGSINTGEREYCSWYA
jgi:hypothetical protein